jgi:hypothetical protein
MEAITVKTSGGSVTISDPDADFHNFYCSKCHTGFWMRCCSCGNVIATEEEIAEAQTEAQAKLQEKAR